MTGETPITIVGNLTADPELRFTPSGDSVANFTVASTPRTYNRTSGQWEDGESLFLRCSVWRNVAENVSESLTKGMRVIVTGRLKARSYTDREGQKRTSYEIDVDEVGPSLKWASASVTKKSASGGSSWQGGSRQGQDHQGGNSWSEGSDSWSSNQSSAPNRSADQPDPWVNLQQDPPF